MAASTIKTNVGFGDIATSTDLVNVVKPGLYFCNGVYRTTGESLQWGFLIVISDNSKGNIKQIWFPNAGEQISTRTKSNGSWGSWKGISLS